VLTVKKEFSLYGVVKPPLPILLGSKVPGKPVRAADAPNNIMGKDQAIIPQH
jgi:hypothetical protein